MKMRAQGSELWNLYQTNHLFVSTSSMVLGRGGPRIARHCDMRDMKPAPDAEADIILLGAESGAKFEDAFLHGRKTGDQVDFDLARYWIKTCSDVHGESCLPMRLLDQSRRPSRLIDVEKGMVVEAKFPCSYAALSYRWTERQLTLRQSTYADLTASGGLYNQAVEVPLTIKESMVLCCRMSIKFLWVDALCILQDDALDKQGQITIMDAIYTGADFTIVAATGPESRGGLPGVRRGTRSIQRTEVVGNLTLAVAQPSLEFAIEDSSWHTRAWTFQFRKLYCPERLLIFTDFGVFFQCNNAVWSEDTHLELPTQHANRIRKVETPIPAKPFWKDVIPTEGDFYDEYAPIVEDYNRRSMTYQSDALNAFGGLMSALEGPLETKFFQGLPIRNFHTALLFQLTSIEDGSRRHGFPSWSWAGRHPAEGIDYEDAITLAEEICDDCDHFYRLQTHPGRGRQVVPIEPPENSAFADPVTYTSHPDIENTIIGSLTPNEAQSLLIFEAWKAVLFVDTEIDDSLGRYDLRLWLSDPAEHSPFNARVGTVRLPPSWRKPRGYYKAFVTMGPQHKYEQDLGFEVFLIEKDQRGISYRVNMCGFTTATWMKAERTLETIYML